MLVVRCVRGGTNALCRIVYLCWPCLFPRFSRPLDPVLLGRSTALLPSLRPCELKIHLEALMITQQGRNAAGVYFSTARKVFYLIRGSRRRRCAIEAPCIWLNS